MSKAATVFHAWRDATTSTLDHLLAMAAMVLFPVGVLGWAGGALLVESQSLEGWMLIRLGLDVLIGPLTLLLGLHLADEDTFFSPTPAVGLVAVCLERYWQAFKLYLPIALLIHPMMGLFAIPGIILAYLGLGLLDPFRWLEGEGRLWGIKGAGILLLGATPMILAAQVGQFLFGLWDVAIIRDSTAGMFALDQMMRTLMAVWGWAVIMRLRRTVV